MFLFPVSLPALCVHVILHSTQGKTTDLPSIGHRSFGIPREGGSDVKCEQNASALPSWNVADKNKRV